MNTRRFWIIALIGVILLASVVLLGFSLYRISQNNQTISELRSANSTLQARLNAQADDGTVQRLEEELTDTKNTALGLQEELDRANETIQTLNGQTAELQETQARLTAVQQELIAASETEQELNAQI